MFVAALPSPDTAPAESSRQDRQAAQNPTSSLPEQPSAFASNVSSSTNHSTPYYPYETIGPKTHTHFTRPTTTYWQETIPTSSVSSLPYSTIPPYQYSYPARLAPSTSLLLPIRPLGDTTDDTAVCSLALPHASMSVVRELARVVADGIRKFEPEVVMGLPTGGLVLAPFVAEELGFNRHIPWGYTKKPWYGDDLTTKISCIFDAPGQEPPVYLDPNLLSLVKGKRVALIDDVISSGTTMSAMLKFLTEEVVEDVESDGLGGTGKEGKKSGGLGLNVVCVGVGMLQGEKYTNELSEEVVRMIVGAVKSPLLKAVEGGWVQR